MKNNSRSDANANAERVRLAFDYYDKEETIHNCAVQILTNTKTGAVSVGWWREDPEYKGE